jgi:DNA-3-methyladenine glycosylase I
MTDSSADKLVEGDDGTHRCWWCAGSKLYRDYHDKEWGFPVAEDRRLFEKICLEAFQSGLSWITILRKRENFRRAFDHFEMEAVAEYDEADLERLLDDAGIVRNRQKIEATINNAGRALDIIDEFGSLAAFIWQFEPPEDERPERVTAETIPAKTDTSKQLAKALKSHGFKFVGPTTAYAFMQAMGLVNDHLQGCDVRSRVDDARREFERP